MSRAASLDPAEIAEWSAWLRLLETPGVGRVTARRLLAVHGSAQSIFAASPASLAALVDRKTALALVQPPEGWAALVERTRAWLEKPRPGEPAHHLIVLGDGRYPPLLGQLADPPLLLHAVGRLELLERAAVAVVGSRNPTVQGVDLARTFAAGLSQAGITVVSGLALGIDAAAHEGGLSGPGGTIAVVGTGLDRIYPRSHLALGRRIAETGLLLSEFVLGTPPLAAHFPQRNRLIAGLSLGTLVVEANVQSGSLITARLASEAGREVMAIPGSIHSPQSRGCHALIKQGAKLVESLEDILEELRILPGAACPVAAEGPDPAGTTAPGSDDGDSPDPVLRALGWSPATLEVLQLRTGQSATDLTVRLFELEMDGHIARLPGEIFQRKACA